MQVLTKYVNWSRHFIGLNKTSFKRFIKVILSPWYEQSQRDYTMLIKHLYIREVTTLLVYIDNIIVTCDNEEEKLILKQCLYKEFEIKKLE